MSEDLTLFQTCLAEYPIDGDLGALLSCTSDAHVEATSDLAAGVDAFFLIYAGALVFFMQVGFAMLCAGSIRAKNVKNVILWNCLDSAGGGIAFWATGYAFTFGSDDPDAGVTFVGNKGFFLQNIDLRYEFWFFQWAFACAVSSIVAGTVAERLQMATYFYYSVFMIGFVYPVAAHSFWSVNGFISTFATDDLFGSGVLDFAGSGPVHFLGGVGSLACALILGPRMGRFHDRDGNPLDVPNDIPPHSVALQMLGTLALWFGWYGFNPGSALFTSSAATGGVAAIAAVNTTLGACAAAVCCMVTGTILDYFALGYTTYDLTYAMNGCLTGLAAITAGCAGVETWGAVLIGMGAGWTYIAISKLLIKLRIDDAVDAIPVHMGGGAWGLFAFGLLAEPDLIAAAFGQEDHAGLFYGGDWTLLGCQLLAIVWLFGWTFFTMGGLFFALNMAGLLRVDPLEEETGLDISRHKGPCYDMMGNASDAAVQELHASRHGMTEIIPSKPKEEVETATKEAEA